MEFNEKNLEEIIKILDENKIKYNKKIKNYFNNQAESKRGADLAEDTFELLSDIAVNSINSGFDKKKIKDIGDLTDVLVSMSKDDGKNEKKIIDGEKVVQSISKGLKLKENDAEVNTVDAVKKQIDTAIKGIRATMAIEGYYEPEHIELLNKAIEKLKDFDSRLSNVKDMRSETAAVRQTRIYRALNNWSDMVARRAFNPYNSDQLLSIVDDELKHWENLREYSKVDFSSKAQKFEKGNINDLYFAYRAATEGLNGLDRIKTSFNYYKKRYSNRPASKAEQDLNRYSETVNKLDDEIKAVRNKFKNGEIKESEALAIIKKANTQKKQYEAAIKKLEAQVDKRSIDEFKINVGVIDALEREFDLINELSNNLVAFYQVMRSYEINFELLEKLFGGLLTKSGRQDAMFEFEKLRKAYDEVVKESIIEIETSLDDMTNDIFEELNLNNENEQTEDLETEEARNLLYGDDDSSSPEENILDDNSNVDDLIKILNTEDDDK